MKGSFIRKNNILLRETPNYGGSGKYRLILPLIVWRFVWRCAFWSSETDTSVAMGVEESDAHAGRRTGTACGVAGRRGVTPPG